jgi:DNA-directed RNA polymerase subunit L
MSQLNINTISQREDKTVHANHLHLKIKGETINHVIINTIRRIMLEELPGYAFDVNKISIKNNTSVFNNDYIRNRIENLPIPNLENKFDVDEYESIRNIILNNIIQDKDDDINNYHLLNMYLKKKNDSDHIINITSDDCEFYLKGKKIKSIYNNPILICKLKPNEEIELSTVINKSIPLQHSRYSLVGISCFEQVNENEYIFKYENRDQINNKEIFNRTCKIIIFRLKNFLSKIKNQKFLNNNHGKIILENENHTMGNLIARGLQDDKNINFAAYKMDHLLIKELTIEYIINNNKSINEILNKTVNQQIKIYEEIIKKFNLLK